MRHRGAARASCGADETVCRVEDRRPEKWTDGSSFRRCSTATERTPPAVLLEALLQFEPAAMHGIRRGIALDALRLIGLGDGNLEAGAVAGLAHLALDVCRLLLEE